MAVLVPNDSRSSSVWQMRSGFIYKCDDNRVAIVQDGSVQCYWEFPDPIFRVSCCNEVSPGVSAFVLTLDRTLWRLDLAHTGEGEPPAKRVKYTLQGHSEGAAVIQVSRDLIMADALAPVVWIQAYTLDGARGCLVYHNNGSMIFYPVNGAQTTITSRHTVDSNFITSDDVVSQTYVPASLISSAMHCNGKRIDGVVFGTNKGNVYYKAVDESKELCILDHPESMHSIHTLSTRMNDSDDETISGIAVVSIEGTLTIALSTGDPPTLQVDEFCISSQIVAAAVLQNLLYTVTTDNVVYKTTILFENHQDVSVREMVYGEPLSEGCIVDIGLLNETTSNGHRVIGILKDGKLSDISKQTGHTKDHDPTVLQEEIQKTLQEIERCQQAQTKLDKTHEFLNSMLVEYNLTIHKLQRVLRAKLKSNTSIDNGDPFFVCNIRPRVTEPSLRTLVPIETLLRVQLQSGISMKWAENWQLCIEMDPCHSILDEPQTETPVPGELYTCSLEGLKTSVPWERDFPVHIGQLNLPLYVTVNLVFTPVSNDHADQPDIAIDNQVLFPVHGIFLDMLSYALPSDGPAKANIDFRGRTAALSGPHPSTGIFASAMNRTFSTTAPRSLTLNIATHTSSSQANEQIQRLLSTLLEEGLERSVLEQILVRPDQAVFSLPLCRKTPVSISVRRAFDASMQGPKYNIVIACSHSFILLKAAQAVAMRLTMIMSEHEEAMFDYKNIHCELHQDMRHVEDLFLRPQSGNVNDIALAYTALSERCLSSDLGTISLI